MKRIIQYIQQHLSLRLGLLIMLVVGGVLSVTMVLLFYQTKQYVHQVAVNQANDVLDETVLNISGIIERTELATLNTAGKVGANLSADSLLSYTLKMVNENPVLQGFTIALEPGCIDGYERFTTYSYRKPDSVYSMIKDDYEYTHDDWYNAPKEQRKAIWLEPYEYKLPVIDNKPRYYFSYSAPIYASNGRFLGVACSDLSLFWLSNTVTAVKPFPHSSAIMLGHDGRYIVHPDTLKQVRESIFSDPDPQARKEVVRLGQSMISGQSGFWPMVVDGQPAHVFYRSMQSTRWSIAIVCPDSDVFGNYNRMLNIVWTIIILFLLLLLLLCYLSIRKAVVPINLLAESARSMTDSRFENDAQSVDRNSEPILHYTTRKDSVGLLQNSFVRMSQALNVHVSELRRVNAEMEQRNHELQLAYKLANGANERKIVFIQNMTHQVRTPLNIIMGFTQVITAGYLNLSESEQNELFEHMKSSVKVLNRINRMLTATSTFFDYSIDNHSNIACNALCREIVTAISNQVPEGVSLKADISKADNLSISTDREAITSILTELLENALRFTHQGSITLTCYQQNDQMATFVVTDTGIGIAPEDRDCIFTPFIKLDSFTEGIGLGLPLSRHTARMLGGELVLDDTYTNGTRFILTLPVNHYD